MPSNQQQIRPFTVKKVGAKLSDNIYNKITSIEVDDSMSLPSMFTIRLLLDPDDAFQFLDSNDFSIGQEIEIIAEDVTTDPSQDSGEDTILKGEITAIEPVLSTDFGATLVIRGYDKSHRLHRGKKTRTFLNVTDSDIVKKIAGENGLSVDSDSTSVTHEHVYQDNQTDWEFISARAARVGYTFYGQDSKLYFKKSLSTATSVELEWASELLQFNARVTAANQVDKVIVQSFDPAKQQAISSEKSSPTEWEWGGITKKGGSQAQDSFGGSRSDVVVDQPVGQVEEAGLIAQGILDGYAQRYIQADCKSLGRYKVRASALVKLSRLGTRFSGKYRVTRAHHLYNNKEGYRTDFTVGNRHTTVSEILAPKPNGSEHGPAMGIVTNNKDDKNQGRVKVKYPWLSDKEESYWARLVAPGGGKERGLEWIPEIDDEVLVVFEHNDFNRPLVMGGLWSDKNTIPSPTSEAVKDGKVNQRILKSRSGHAITLDDSDGAEKIIVCDKTKKNEIIIDSASNSMTVKVDKDITIEAKGKIAVSTSSGDIIFEGNNLSIKTKQAFKVEATGACNIKSIQSCTVEGTAGLTLKNAAAQIAMSGPTVNINNGALEVM